MRILFPQENACHLCGRWTQHGMLCARCMDELSAQLLPLQRQALYRRGGLCTVVSCWRHRSVPRRLVHQLKYHTDPHAAVLLGEGMTRALRNERRVLERVELVATVPLHPEREKERGYNQAALLAGEICARTGLGLAQNVLCRTHATGPQVRLNRAQRLAAMRGAFAVTDPALVRGRCILLVDDVFTTGATALACAEALYQAGAAEVHVITACRA